MFVRDRWLGAIVIVLVALAWAGYQGRSEPVQSQSSRGCVPAPWQWDPHLDWQAGPAC